MDRGLMKFCKPFLTKENYKLLQEMEDDNLREAFLKAIAKVIQKKQSEGLDDICRDIDEALSYADEMIHYEADRLATAIYDNYLLATFAPYPEEQEIDETIVGDIACSEEFSMDKAVTAYAYELWRVGIEKSLRRILREKCSKAGKLRRVLARVI